MDGKECGFESTTNEEPVTDVYFKQDLHNYLKLKNNEISLLNDRRKLRNAEEAHSELAKDFITGNSGQAEVLKTLSENIRDTDLIKKTKISEDLQSGVAVNYERTTETSENDEDWLKRKHIHKTAENDLEGISVKSSMKILPFLDYSKRVLVVGELILDKYIYGEIIRMAAEHPIPVFDETSVKYCLGGAGNVCINLQAMGVTVHLLSVIGYKDDRIKDVLQQNGMGTDGLIECPNFRVKVIKRYVCRETLYWRSDRMFEYKACRSDMEKLKAKFAELMQKYTYQAVVFSDYRCGMLVPELCQEIISVAKRNGIPTIVDPNRRNYHKFYGTTYIKPNLTDARNLCQREVETSQDIFDACKLFCERLQAETCILTMAEKGIALYESNVLKIANMRFKIIPQTLRSNRALHVCGAGDTVLAALAFGISNQLLLEQTCEIANICAANVIQRQGTVSVRMVDIIPDKVLTTKHELENLKRIIPNEYTVVLTTGCFDMLHLGHVGSLKQAKELGDILVVALNSDSSVKKLKGETRPVISVKRRCGVLLSVKYVDFIVIFDEEAPYWVVETLDPDVFVKGAEYTEDRVRRLFPYIRKFHSTKEVDPISTTDLIEKLKQL